MFDTVLLIFIISASESRPLYILSFSTSITKTILQKEEEEENSNYPGPILGTVPQSTPPPTPAPTLPCNLWLLILSS